ncbi:hypothetical protein V6Z11_D11G361400 [Gossypium hirsutum]
MVDSVQLHCLVPALVSSGNDKSLGMPLLNWSFSHTRRNT